MREARRVSYINYISLLSMCYLALRILLNITNLLYCFRLLVLIIFAIIVLLLNYRRMYTLAKICLFTVFVTGTFILSYVYLGGFKYGSFVLLLAAVPWPFMLFDSTQRVLTFLSLGYLISCFMMMIILQYVHPLPVSESINIDAVRVSVAILTLFFLLLLTWYFSTSNAEAEEILLQEKEKAESANRAKSRFLANMSHELRTPMNAILGFAELMQRDSSITKEQRANLATIGRSGAHLLSLINDVLEFSKIEAGRIELHPENFKLQHLLLSLKEMFQLPVQKKGLTLDIFCDSDVPQYVHADQNKLRQILINILGNAVKFTDKGGVTLSLTLKGGHKEQASGQDFLRFEIVDTGTGISEEEQENIFDAFFQSEFQQSTHQGAGLGLPISQKITMLMGGALEVTSKLGRGTQFILDIPLKHGEGSRKEQDCGKRVISLAPRQQAYRLLIVEDDESNRNLLLTLLSNAGFEVQKATNGLEAIECWRRWQPHLIWMDIRMPVMDGYEAIKTIKAEMQQNQPVVDTKIIALTASAFEDDRRKILKLGCDGFIGKPFKECDIFNMISRQLGVDFIYQESVQASREVEGEKEAAMDVATAVNYLSTELRERLIEATELSDATLIDRVIEVIRDENRELAELFSELAENFAYDKILVLVQNFRTESVNSHQGADIYFSDDSAKKRKG